MHKIILTPNLIHYGKEVDENGKFIKWISNPNEISYKEKTAYLLDELLIKCPNNYFVKSCASKFVDGGKLSPKQEVLEKIKRRQHGRN